jgi:hypothetical protein
VQGWRGSLLQKLRLTFTPFGRTALEHYARSAGITMAVMVSRAASYLAADLESGRPELKALSLDHSDESHPVELELDLEDDTASALESEAARQHVTLEEMLEFAAVYYVADMESGLAAERILKRMEQNS